MPKGRANEPLSSNRFIVDFKSKLKGVFTEVSVASAEFEVIQYKYAEKDGKPGYYAAPGAMKAPEITLKRGVTEDDSAWKWSKEVQDGKMDSARANGTIIMADYDGTPLLEYNIVRAWPKSVKMPGPNAGQNQVLVEEIVLVCEDFKRAK
ncbi:MAG: phage tail protein [Anaerolineae bacterium]|nr:phage tail protein [Anaerolineae bacterium]